MMSRNQSAYTWEGWDSSGKEDGAFSVTHPRQLMGVHARLIDKELRASENVECCFYSPRIPTTVTPFSLEAPESSSGICVTDKRFIISNNLHSPTTGPTLQSVNFEDVLSFNIGSAMLLSWFSLEFACGRGTKRLTILFSSNSKHHFQKALRVFKKYSPVIRWNNLERAAFAPAAFMHKVKDPVHREYFRTLFGNQEKCILTFSCRYICKKTVRTSSVFTRKEQSLAYAGKATVLLTDKALMVARDSVEYAIGTSVDVFAIALAKVKSVRFCEENCAAGSIHKLEVFFGGDIRRNMLDMDLTGAGEESRRFLTDIALLLNKEGSDGKL